ncbi:MAG: response regulator [Lentisphaerae bacterium]|nr:response regulator [Lentisphaerota bacterium]
MPSEETKKTILLIDDDTSLLVTLSDFLTFEGYRVVMADSGEEGLKRLAHTRPDLIVLDMSMPGMGGVGFLKAISSADGKPKYPVLVLTARANMAEFFANVDVDGFVAKPCDPGDLLLEISRIVFLRSGEEQPGGTHKAAQKKKVLLGEDDGAVRESLVAALTAAGYVVEPVAHGPDVLERAIVSRPDAIAVKLVLAGMNGDAVAKVLRTMPTTKTVPIVLYDDSQAEVPEARFTKSSLRISRFVRSSNAPAVVAAVGQALET